MPFIIIYTLICLIAALIFAEKEFGHILVATLSCFLLTPLFGIWFYNKTFRNN